MDVLRRSARKSRLERIKNVHIKEIMGVKEEPDIIEKKRLQWYGHVKRMQEERLTKLIMEWIPGERRKRGSPRKTWMEGVRAAMKTRHFRSVVKQKGMVFGFRKTATAVVGPER
jgi:IS5 family transposase